VKVSVTPLSAAADDLAGAAAATVAYVCGPAPAPEQRSLVSGTPHSPVGYYADSSVEGPGRWLGRGAPRLGLGGEVGRDDLSALLCGEHPGTGVSVRDESRSTGAAPTNPPDGGATDGWDRAEFTFAEAASLVGVDARYLRRVAARTRALLARTDGTVESLARVEADGRAFLIADQGEDGKWRVAREELERFAAARQIRNVVTGYDVTFSAPKSVSILWALGDDATRAAVVDAVDRAVDAGMGFLERECGYWGRGEHRQQGQGLTGAAFTHGTSRNLDPQLHVHVLVANVIETAAGGHRAVDGSALFAYAKTAGYLAAAALRHELSTRFGISWRPIRSGIAEIAGVPQRAIEQMSTRRAEIDARAEELEITSARGREEIALRTRAAKPAATNLAALRDTWHDRLAELGVDTASLATCCPGPRDLEAPTADEIAGFFLQLARHDGLTAHAPTFDRRDVLQAVVDWAGPRLDVIGVEALADEFLASELVVALDADSIGRNRAQLARRRGHTRRPLPGVPIPAFTTPLMVAAECEIVSGLRAGLRTDVAVVSSETLLGVVDGDRGLTREQRDAIRRLCRSGHQSQCLVGPAGSGKTRTIRTAADAWSAAGYSVLGLAVQGTAAEHLADATGLPTETVASFLTRAERDEHGLDARSVVVIDEASALGTFDAARLTRLTRRSGAKLVLVGDPAQHSSVSAGGAFAALVRHHPTSAAQLEEVHRHDDSMASVGEALRELRIRDTDTALHRLVVDDRVLDAPNPEAAYDALVSDWHQDRIARQADPSRARSCMITEHHRVRRALIARAREVLQTAGELTGPALEVRGQQFQAGDEVICRTPARDLHPVGAPERYLRNGTLGTVIDVQVSEPVGSGQGVWVDFAGRGRVFVPVAALEREVRPGAPGVLTHSYALTSHAAQGATFEAARALVTESTSPAALYVASSRARSDVRLYTTRRDSWRDPDTEQGHARVRDDRSGLQALAASLRSKVDGCLAIELDPSLVRLSDDPLLQDFATRSRPVAEMRRSDALDMPLVPPTPGINSDPVELDVLEY